MKVSLKTDGHIYDVEIQDLNKRPIVAIVDGEIFEIQPESQLGTSVSSETAPAKAIPHSADTSSGRALLAPLPGTVTEIFVLPGAQVETGQPICVIEAMKMKNTIRADRSGIIANVPINPGQPVKHKQALVEFDD